MKLMKTYFVLATFFSCITAGTLHQSLAAEPTYTIDPRNSAAEYLAKARFHLQKRPVNGNSVILRLAKPEHTNSEEIYLLKDKKLLAAISKQRLFAILTPTFEPDGATESHIVALFDVQKSVPNLICARIYKPLAVKNQYFYGGWKSVAVQKIESEKERYVTILEASGGDAGLGWSAILFAEVSPQCELRVLRVHQEGVQCNPATNHCDGSVVRAHFSTPNTINLVSHDIGANMKETKKSTTRLSISELFKAAKVAK